MPIMYDIKQSVRTQNIIIKTRSPLNENSLCKTVLLEVKGIIYIEHKISNVHVHMLQGLSREWLCSGR